MRPCSGPCASSAGGLLVRPAVVGERAEPVFLQCALQRRVDVVAVRVGFPVGDLVDVGSRIVLDDPGIVDPLPVARGDFVGEGERRFSPAEGARILQDRPLRQDLAPAALLPDDTRLWAALQLAGGGTWGGCVYDV